MEHFGVKLIKRGKEFKLIRDEFALIDTKPSVPFFQNLEKRNAYTDEIGTSYREEWCKEYRELCLKNYDLNMKYFSMLDKVDFEKTLQSFLVQYKNFKSITDLNDYSHIEGYYIMVLDEYKQMYIGKSSDIKKRIMQHWSKTRAFDRTLFPMYAYDSSCFSIDFFRALDTTRIFVWQRKIKNGIESKLVDSYPSKYLINRIGGDITGGIKAAITMNTRQL